LSNHGQGEAGGQIKNRQTFPDSIMSKLVFLVDVFLDNQPWSLEMDDSVAKKIEGKCACDRLRDDP
jgi:hypothetical protein